MPKEKADFRDWMEQLNEDFPGRQLLKKSEVAGWLGISKTTLRERYNLPPGQLVSKVAIARAVSGS